MPSPFPGMDPFLEHPAVFADLHDRLVVNLSDALQARLPEPYFAGIGSRIWVEASHRFIEPDVKVHRRNEEVDAGEEPAGGVAVATGVRTKPVVVTVPHDERRETFVQIFHGSDGARLVTAIEVLSLANKTAGEHGRELYQRKQRDVLDSKTHLVEMDLLRGGEHTTAVPLKLARSEAGPFDYHVCIHRFDNLEDYFVYPVLLAERLPEIAIPLLPGDPDIALDLQAVFHRCYDTGPYRRAVRYRLSAVVPLLNAEQERWAARLLKDKGVVAESG